MADNFIQVPGGGSINNYGNVDLITETAERVGAHAVWAGWGHASEKPQLPDQLAKTKNGVSAQCCSASFFLPCACLSHLLLLLSCNEQVVWIGPPSSAMRALGDKIGSTLIAQTAGVPCVAWSGSGLDSKYTRVN